MIESLQNEEASLMFSGKEVDFARLLLDKQHEFNGTSLEVNKIRQSFIWSSRSTEISIKLFTKSSRNKRRSFSISFISFYETNLLSSPKSGYMFSYV